MKSTDISSFLWKIADLLRDDFKRGKYQDVILPLTVLRRLDCVLAPTKEKVLADHAKYKGKIEDLSSRLKHTAKVPFYNTSRFDFKKLLEDGKNLRQNYTTYLNGFSENIRDILEKFKFHEILNDLQKAKLFFFWSRSDSRMSISAPRTLKTTTWEPCSKN